MHGASSSSPPATSVELEQTLYEAVEDLVPVLEAAFAGGGIHLIEVPIDYSENTRVLVEELRNRSPDVELA
ncbi:MAG: hypothetical protein J0I07_12265 [Myxococcales bacterium]|nr:hypothetical protein [Myxococcales bacterium]